MILKPVENSHPDFLGLVNDLDQDLLRRNGALQNDYGPYNGCSLLDLVIVAYSGEDPTVPLGCGAFKRFTEDGHQAGIEIKRMFVVPEYRGKGAAGRILCELEKIAVRRGYARAFLETGRNQSEAIALYQKQGYRIIPNYGPYRDNSNSLCFCKNLG